MKNTLSAAMIFVMLFGGNLACRFSPSQITGSQCNLNAPKLDTAQQYVERASSQMISGNYECAFDDCRAAVRLDAKNVMALACRGAVHRKRGRFDLAKADFDEALRIEPGNEMVLYNRSLLYQETQSYDLALADINQTIAHAPAHYYYVVRASIYFDKGDYENAAGDYTEAIRLKPDNQEYYAQRARVYRRAKQIELAEADEEKSREIQREDADSLDPNSEKNLGAVLNERAVSLPKPVYPKAAQTVKAGGEVVVQIEVDARGNVISAKIVSGHPLLRAVSESAARQAKFKPSAAMSGILVYNFTA